MNRDRKPDMELADKHIEQARLLVEHAKQLAIEKYPAAAKTLIRRTALSYLRTATEIAFGDNGYPWASRPLRVNNPGELDA